jgi:hypothetical protein
LVFSTDQKLQTFFTLFSFEIADITRLAEAAQFCLSGKDIIRERQHGQLRCHIQARHVEFVIAIQLQNGVLPLPPPGRLAGCQAAGVAIHACRTGRAVMGL